MTNDECRSLAPSRNTGRAARATADEFEALFIGLLGERTRSKNALLDQISHELRTPLNAIIGYSEILLEELGSDGRAGEAECLRKINAAGKRMTKLIDFLLDIQDPAVVKVWRALFGQPNVDM